MKNRDTVYVIKSKKSGYYLTNDYIEPRRSSIVKQIKTKNIKDAEWYYDFQSAFDFMIQSEKEKSYHVVQLNKEDYVNEPRYIAQLEADASSIKYEKEQLKHNKIIWQ